MTGANDSIRLITPTSWFDGPAWMTKVRQLPPVCIPGVLLAYEFNVLLFGDEWTFRIAIQRVNDAMILVGSAHFERERFVGYEDVTSTDYMNAATELCQGFVDGIIERRWSQATRLTETITDGGLDKLL